jgi:hypothetical protein
VLRIVGPTSVIDCSIAIIGKTPEDLIVRCLVMSIRSYASSADVRSGL